MSMPHVKSISTFAFQKIEVHLFPYKTIISSMLHIAIVIECRLFADNRMLVISTSNTFQHMIANQPEAPAWPASIFCQSRCCIIGWITWIVGTIIYTLKARDKIVILIQLSIYDSTWNGIECLSFTRRPKKLSIRPSSQKTEYPSLRPRLFSRNRSRFAKWQRIPIWCHKGHSRVATWHPVSRPITGCHVCHNAS